MRRHPVLQACAVGALAAFYAAVSPAATLYPTTEFRSLVAPVGVVIADVNGDGKPDVVVNSGSNGVAVFLGRGNDQFDPPLANYRTDTNGAPQAIAVGDVNGDGKPDLVVANTTSNDVTVLLGEGNGLFKGQRLDGIGTPAPSYPVGNNPKYVVLADLRGNGRLDIITANYQDGTISVLLNNGDGTFGAQVTYGVGLGPDCLIAADLDGDGKMDLLVLNSVDNTIDFMKGDGTGKFSHQTIIPLGLGQQGVEPQSMAAADFNHDGKLDLAVTVTGVASNGIKVLLGDGKGGFPTSRIYHVGLEPEFVTIADVDQDGNADILAMNAAEDTLSVLYGRGDGTFGRASTYSLSGIAGAEPLQALVVGDFDNDGFPDIVFPFLAHQGIRVIGNDGKGGFHIPGTYATAGVPSAVATADLNGDGKADVVVLSAAEDKVEVRLGNGDGTLQAPTGYPVGNNPQVLALADVNGDGKTDIITANFGDGTVSVLLGNGDGTFQPQMTFAVGENLLAMTVADVDGDGKPDIVVGNGISNTIGILYGRGDGTFRAPVILHTDIVLDDVAVGDVNGDGHADIVVGGSAISVYLNDGHGGFEAKSRYVAHGFHLKLADVNHDGRLDVLVSDYNASSLDVLLGNGDGTFQPPQSFPTDTSPLDFTLADVNGDGNLDAVMACSNGFSVSVMLGNGRGGFINTSYPAEINPRATAVEDMDGDGKPDLVVANAGSNDLNLFLQNHGVVAADHAPEAVSQIVPEADGRTPLSGVLGATDTDKGDALSYAVTLNAANGTVSVDPASGAFVYQANAGFVGTDSFEFQATDSMKLSNRATVTIQVLTNPTGGGGGRGSFGLLPILALGLLLGRRRAPAGR